MPRSPILACTETRAKVSERSTNDDTLAVGTSSLRRQAAIWPDDKRYAGKTVSRKDLEAQYDHQGIVHIVTLIQ